MTSVEDKVRKVNLERRPQKARPESRSPQALPETCLLYTSDAADE